MGWLSKLKSGAGIASSFVPGVSAARSFAAGDIRGGFTDLAFDALYFVPGGAAVRIGARALKLGVKAARGTRKVRKVRKSTRILRQRPKALASGRVTGRFTRRPIKRKPRLIAKKAPVRQVLRKGKVSGRYTRRKIPLSKIAVSRNKRVRQQAAFVGLMGMPLLKVKRPVVRKRRPTESPAKIARAKVRKSGEKKTVHKGGRDNKMVIGVVGVGVGAAALGAVALKRSRKPSLRSKGGAVMPRMRARRRGAPSRGGARGLFGKRKGGGKPGGRKIPGASSRVGGAVGMGGGMAMMGGGGGAGVGGGLGRRAGVGGAAGAYPRRADVRAKYGRSLSRAEFAQEYGYYPKSKRKRKTRQRRTDRGQTSRIRRLENKIDMLAMSK